MSWMTNFERLRANMRTHLPVRNNARRTLLALMVVQVVASLSVLGSQERFDHPTAGIAFTPPPGWHAATLAQVQANRERTRLSDPELQAALATRSALPLAVFAKYEEPHPGLNPSVQVTLRAALRGTPTQLLAIALETMRRAFADFRIVAPVHSVQVAGWPAAHVRVTYTLNTNAGASARVLSRLWLIPRGRLMFLIGMSGAETGADVSEQEFAEVLQSIVIQK
jgi:hypothetical protein